MIFLNNIPEIKFYKMKTYLPSALKSRIFGSCILLNTLDTDTDIKLINHNLINGDRYNCYYIDYLYKGKIWTKSYRENIKKYRSEYIYPSIESSCKRMKTFSTIKSINNKNLFYSLYVYNDIFFNNTRNIPYIKRVDLYLEQLKFYFSIKELKSYQPITMLIDFNEWNSYSNNSDNVSIKRKFDNPITILYYSMKKRFEKFKEVGNVDIIIVFENGFMRLNPSLCDEKSFMIFKQEMNKAKRHNNIIPDDLEENTLDTDDETIDNISNIFVDKYNLVGNDGVNKKDNTDLSKDKKIKEIVKSEVIDIVDGNEEKIQSDDVKKQIEQNTEALIEIDSIIKSSSSGKTTMSMRRDQELKKRQSQLSVGGTKLEDIVNRKIPKIDTTDVSSNIKSTNENIKEVTFPNFEKKYNEELYQKDILNVFTDLANKSLPMYILDIQVEDTSDELNLKQTYTIKLEDENRTRHTIKVDLPIFYQDKFLYLGGNTKIIDKQQFMKPIVKTNKDTVQIVTDYNKMFVRRIGDKVSSYVEQLKKYFSNNSPNGITIKYGNNGKINLNYKTTLEYDYLSQVFSEIITKDHRFIFNQESLEQLLSTKNIKHDLHDNQWMIVGIDKNNNPLYLNNNELIEGTDSQLVTFIVDSIGKSCPDVKKEINSISSGKRFMYTSAKSMNREVPLIILVSFFQGLSKTLRKANISHYFTDKNPSATITKKQEYIRFSNGYLVYDCYPIQNSLLMQGFNIINSKAYEYESFDDRETYLNIFDDKYNARSLGKYFLNVYESMIDPIAKSVLELLGYPTELSDLLLYANELLSDNAYIPEINMNLSRIRSNEIVASFLYKTIANEYNNYRNISMVSKNRKMSIKQDAVIKQVLTCQIVEDYSRLNPIVELEKSRAITSKGPSGLNVSRAYTQEKRSFDKSMLGLMAISTSPDANCGVVRSLVLEPKVNNARGFIDINDDNVDSLKDANLFSPAEMLTPESASCDDANRIGMATKQSKHIIPVNNASPVLVSNGVEQVIHYHLSDDFSVVATDDGEVIDIDEKSQYMIVKYKNGENKAIDLSVAVVKNGAGGFYLPIKKITNLKKGDKFKKNDILAFHDKFFTDDKINGNRFNIGTLIKTAIFSTGETFEDSTFFTSKLSDNLSSDIIIKIPVRLGPNSNVDYISKVGQDVEVGDELIRFETSYEEDYIGNLLADIGEDLQEEIKSYGKKPIKSKISGTIVNIEIYHTVELEQLTPSLKNIVENYNKDIMKRKKVLEKHSNPGDNAVLKCGTLFTNTTGKIEPKDGKIHGEYVGEGVLILFSIQYTDKAGIGDKIANFTALKSIAGNIVPEGLEPFALSRPDEEISTFIPPGAILARMTPSIIKTMFANKVIIELKRKLQEIYNE